MYVIKPPHDVQILLSSSLIVLRSFLPTRGMEADGRFPQQTAFNTIKNEKANTRRSRGWKCWLVFTAPGRVLRGICVTFVHAL